MPSPGLTLTLWVSESATSGLTGGLSSVTSPTQGEAGSSTPAGTEDSLEAAGGRYRYGVPLSTFYNSEIVLNPDLKKNEQLGGLSEGDLVQVVSASKSASASLEKTLLFRVSRSCWAREGASQQLQISISSSLGSVFGLENRSQVVLSKLPAPFPSECIADHVEVYFKDQYLGRADMHRISLALADTCVYAGQKIQLSGLNIRATIKGIWVAGKHRKSALVTSNTRTVFRSESAKYYIFIELSKEMWTFDDDGSFFFEKVVDLFLPELFSRWEKRETNHIVSLVLFTRILYDREEAEIVERPVLGRPGRMSGGWSDVYKVLVDLETNSSWPDVLRQLRAELHNFREEVLLASSPRQDGKQAGAISAAHEGGVLEAINMALSAFDKHYVDRDLQRTGLSIVIITAGTSHFNVDKNLLRLTMERMVDEGVGVDCVSLAKMPLHAVPLFRYQSKNRKQPRDAGTDFLYIDDDENAQQEMLCAIPHWWDASFYGKHQDKPFRQDRFLPRCRMPGIQNIGRAEYENASISLPPLQTELQTIEYQLSRACRDWQELSEREKRSRIFDRYDEIACGGLGKWEALEAEIGSVNRPSGLSVDSRSRKGSKVSSSPSSQGSHASDGDTTALEGVVHTPEVDRRSLDRGRSTKKAAHLQHSPEATATSLTTPRGSPARDSTSVQSAIGMAAQPERLRQRSDSVISNSTISRRSSSLALRTPSKRPPIASNPSTDRRIVSSSASSVTAVERSQNPSGTASGALASLLANQAKLVNTAKAAGTTEKSSGGGWFWNRKAKPAAPQASPSKATSTTSMEGSSTNGFSVTKNASTNATNVEETGSQSRLATRRVSLSIKPSITSLSLTPATPASQHLTKQASTLSTSAQARPLTIPPTPAAFKVATNDPLSDPHSLEEHSLHQYFLNSIRNDTNVKALKLEIEEAREKRLARLNPSNPSRSSDMLQDQSRRWHNIFPRAGRVNNQRSVKWKSLCTPACLPLYSDYFPLTDDLTSAKYIKQEYSLAVKVSSSSFLLRPGKDVSETAGNLIRELVNQRLAQSFQILMPTYSDILGRKGQQHQNGSQAFRLPSASDIREILYNTPKGESKSIYLGFSDVVHRLRFDGSTGSVIVTSWKSKAGWSRTSIKYSFTIWPVASKEPSTRSVTFSYPDLNAYDWEYTDRLVAGLEEPNLQEQTRYWRTRFILVPAEVPDLQGMVQSQNRMLLEDSTEEDLRIAGIMTLYEQFSKVRWVPPSNGKQKLPPLSYSTTVLDPSLSAASEAERLLGETPTVPLPDAYGADVFFDDYLIGEVAHMMADGPRPIRQQTRRRGFRTTEETFSGEVMVTWLLSEFVDIPTRSMALEKGNLLVEQGHVVPLNPPKRLLDNYSFYTFAPQHRPSKKKSNTWTALGSTDHAASSIAHSAASYTSVLSESASAPSQPVRYTHDNRVIVPMSHAIIINLDPQRKSDRSETAFLHFDVAHNTANGFHFQLNWLGTSRLVEDMLSHWQRNAEKYGLKLVEENVRQIKDIAADNPLQAPDQIRLALPPPDIPDMADLLGPNVVSISYFEKELLRSLGYILDVEADSNFPPSIEAEYSYRKTPYDYSQFIHKSGTCFVQCLGGEEGYLFLKNRLFLSHRQQGRGSSAIPPSDDPAHLKRQLRGICADKGELERRWDEIASVFLATSGTLPDAEIADASDGMDMGSQESVPLPDSFPMSLPNDELPAEQNFDDTLVSAW